jgi:hypothetical protein
MKVWLFIVLLSVVYACNKKTTDTPINPTNPTVTVDLSPLKLPKGVKPDQVEWQNTEGVLMVIK